MNRPSLLRKALLIGCILAANCAYGAPAITNVSGAVSQGGTITIVGNGFGANPSPAPIYYSNFESYPVGTPAVDTGLSDLNGNLGSLEPYVDDTHSVSGTKALRVNYPLNHNGAFPEVGLGKLNLTEVYVSAWIYWEHTAGSGGGVLPIFKLVRAEANPVYHGYPGFYDTIRPNEDGAIVATDQGAISATRVVTYADARNAEPTAGAWHKISYYFQLSTPGVANGVFESWVDGVRNADITNDMLLPAGSTAAINNVISPIDGMSNYGYSNSYSLWVDDFYVAATQARVELGDASTLPACKVRYVQPASSWSDGSISATVETNTFPPGTTAYLYVFDADGNVNSQGYPVTIVASSIPNPPIEDGVQP